MARKGKWLWPGGYIDKRSGYYYIRRDIAGITYHLSTRCKTREGADAELARFEQGPAGYVPGGGPEPDRHDFAEAVTRWLAFSANVKGNSAKHRESQARAFALWARFLEHRLERSLEDMTPSLVDDYIGWRRSGEATAKAGQPLRPVGPHTIGLEVAAIKVLFSWAARPKDQGGFLESDPLARYKIPKRPKGSGRVKVFEMEWWDKVRPHLNERWQLVGDVLLGSAMRYSSLARLSPDNVDLQSDTITLPGNEIKGKDGAVLYVSHRIAMAARQVAMVGIPASSPDFNHALESARLKAGLEHHSAHDFRHSAASMAIEDGVKGKDLQARLVHASFQTTERYISRLGKADSYRGRL